MKKAILLLVLFSFLSLSAQDKNPIVQGVINKVDIDSLSQFVKELSGEVPVNISGTQYVINSRNSNNTMNNVAADYLMMKLKSYGLTTTNWNYNIGGRNVYAVQLGTEYPEQQYIICAHYDDMPSSGNAPGADDNASGTAAVIEAARILSKYEAKYTIIYALWDAEEQGLIGSSYYANRASSNGDQIKGVINLDMIAWDSNNDGRVNIHTRSTGNSIQLSNKMLDVLSTYSIPLIYYINNPGSSYSDHASFWSKGFPAILLIEDDYYNDFNNYYHSGYDKIQYFNFPYYENCSKLAIGTLSEVAEVEIQLPVEMVTFYAETINENVILNWSTATETNNLGFEIERKNVTEDNSNNQYNVIGFVDGKGTSVSQQNYNFTDGNVKSGKYLYRLKQLDFDGTANYSDEVLVNSVYQMAFELKPNYPNPFNPTTIITYQIPSDGNVELKVYNLLGKEVSELVNDFQTSGLHKVEFNASDLSSGNYFYVLKFNNEFQKGKMTLIK